MKEEIIELTQAFINDLQNLRAEYKEEVSARTEQYINDVKEVLATEGKLKEFFDITTDYVDDVEAMYNDYVDDREAIAKQKTAETAEDIKDLTESFVQSMVQRSGEYLQDIKTMGTEKPETGE